MAKSLLLVDDSVAIREVVSLTFETTDLTIRTASNLDEALAKLGRRGTDKSAAEAGLVTLSQEEINMLLDHQAGSR